PGARIGDDCFIGPYCIVGDEVQLGEGVRIESHCVVDGRTSIGAGTHVFPFVSIGLASQDLKYKGEASETRIGERNRIVNSLPFTAVQPAAGCSRASATIASSWPRPT